MNELNELKEELKTRAEIERLLDERDELREQLWRVRPSAGYSPAVTQLRSRIAALEEQIEELRALLP